MATLVARRALFYFCHALLLLFSPLTHAGSVVVGRFAATLLVVESALYAFRVVISCHPPPRRLCGCLFGLYLFDCVVVFRRYFVVLATAFAQWS